MSRYQIYVDQKPVGKPLATMQKAADSVDRADIEQGKECLIYDTTRQGYFKWYRVTYPRPTMRELTSMDNAPAWFKD